MRPLFTVALLCTALALCNAFEITVRSSTDTVTLNVNQGMTIEQLKVILQESLDIPMYSQSLVYRGRVMVSGTLAGFGITGSVTITVVDVEDDGDDCDSCTSKGCRRRCDPPPAVLLPGPCKDKKCRDGRDGARGPQGVPGPCPGISVTGNITLVGNNGTQCGLVPFISINTTGNGTIFIGGSNTTTILSGTILTPDLIESPGNLTSVVVIDPSTGQLYYATGVVSDNFTVPFSSGVVTEDPLLPNVGEAFVSADGASSVSDLVGSLPLDTLTLNAFSWVCPVTGTIDNLQIAAVVNTTLDGDNVLELNWSLWQGVVPPTTPAPATPFTPISLITPTVTITTNNTLMDVHTSASGPVACLQGERITLMTTYALIGSGGAGRMDLSVAGSVTFTSL